MSSGWSASPSSPGASFGEIPPSENCLRHFPHVAMVKRARQAAAKSTPVPARKHAPCRFVHYQVKESVVRRRNGPAKAGLQRSPGFLDGKLPGLPKQVCMQAHDFKGIRKRRGIERRPTTRHWSRSEPRARTMSRTRERVSKSTSSSSSMTHTHTAGSSVESRPVSTCHELTGVGRFRISASADSMIVAVASTSRYRQPLLMLKLERDYSRTAPIWKPRIAAHGSCEDRTRSRAGIMLP